MEKTGAPTFFIKTFGCQMNRDDSREMALLLHGLGFIETDSPAGADLVHVNTCCVRQKAEDKFFSFLGEQRQAKEETGRPAIGVSGCIPERADLAGTHPFVDYVIGSRHPSDYLPGLAESLQRLFPELENLPATASPVSPFSYHTVIRGCTNFCAYCVVPAVRGPEASLEPANVIADVRAKVEAGAKEVTLLGQNVLAYGYDLEPKKHLIDIIEGIHDIPGLEWIRFVTSHPAWVGEDFLRRLSWLPRVCEHFHVPFQSGDDTVLDRMNRGYTAARYVEVMDMIRSYFPCAGITADAIVGFPGETTEQFGNTLRLIERVRPDNIYSFMYSVRPGTAAADWDDDVPLDEKKRRLAELNDLEDVISRDINESLIGETVEVMVERCSGGRCHGRTRTNKLTDFAAGGSHVPGGVAIVRVTGATPHGIQGEEAAG